MQIWTGARTRGPDGWPLPSGGSPSARPCRPPRAALRSSSLGSSLALQSCPPARGERLAAGRSGACGKGWPPPPRLRRVPRAPHTGTAAETPPGAGSLLPCSGPNCAGVAGPTPGAATAQHRAEQPEFLCVSFPSAGTRTVMPTSSRGEVTWNDSSKYQIIILFQLKDTQGVSLRGACTLNEGV